MSESGKDWYFAYGPNMDPVKMGERGIEYWASKKVTLNGYRLTFNCWSDAYGAGTGDIVPSRGSVVEGVIYLVDEEGMRVCDEISGIANNVYKRLVVEVEYQDGNKESAIGYDVVNKSEEVIPPSEAYVDMLIKGAEAHSLSSSYIQMLRNIPVAKS